MRNLSYAVLSVGIALAGCATGIPVAMETVEDSTAAQQELTAPVGVEATPLYIGPTNRLQVHDGAPSVYGRFELTARSKVAIYLEHGAAAAGASVGFKLYRVLGDGQLGLLGTIDGSSGWAGAALRSVNGGTYLVEAAGKPLPAELALDLVCLTDACSPRPQPGEMCGGIAGRACAEGLSCRYPAGTCGWRDASGTCEVPPEACATALQPVCGCDGVTYGNACEAAVAGVTVDRDGPC